MCSEIGIIYIHASEILKVASGILGKIKYVVATFVVEEIEYVKQELDEGRAQVLQIPKEISSKRG